MTDKQVHVAVLICTAKRPKMLLECLQSVADQSLPENTKLSVIVVENDLKPLCLKSVREFSKLHFQPKDIDFTYVVEPKKGIPFARNKTLEICRTLAPDFVAMIDDDQTAAPDWIGQHIKAQKEFQADIIHGHVEYIYETAPPIWIKPPRNKKRHGQLLNRAATGNVMISYHLIDPRGFNLSFDTHFTQGHEDTDFFERAAKFGAKIVFNKKAVTTEFVVASRLDYGRYMERVLQHEFTNTYEQIYKRGWWYAFFRQMTTLKHYSRLLRATLMLMIVPFVWPFSKTTAQKIYYYATKRFTKVFGAFYGLTNRQLNYRDKIDGF